MSERPDRSTAVVADPRSATTAPVRTHVVGPAEPFAPTSYARARLLRQLHACGLLIDDSCPGAPT